MLCHDTEPAIYYIDELPFSDINKDMYAIHASNVRCNGNEARLTECQYSTTHSCLHLEDVFLICKGSINLHSIEITIPPAPYTHCRHR